MTDKKAVIEFLNALGIVGDRIFFFDGIRKLSILFLTFFVISIGADFFLG